MAVWREANPRGSRDGAVHDLRKDGRTVLRGVALDTLMRYVCDHGADGDSYFEDAVPDSAGCTVKSLRGKLASWGW